MMPFKALIIPVVVLLLQDKTKGISFYVAPNNLLQEVCPGQPCLPLEEYVKNSTSYFTANSEFLFLPGSHVLHTSLLISNLSNVSLKGYSSPGSATVMFVGKLVVDSVDTIEVNGLTLLRYFDDKVGNDSLITLTNSVDVTISYAEFKGMNRSGQALCGFFSLIIIYNSHFEGLTGNNGGAISVAHDTHLTIINSSFIRNEAENKGGAVYASHSRVFLLGDKSVFSHNTGCIGCFRKESFESSEGNGGALTVEDGTLNVTGNITFSDNKANIGGAIALNKCNFDATLADIVFTGNLAIIKGGGMHMIFSRVTGTNQNMTFISNIARGSDPNVGDCAVACIFNTNSEIKSLLTLTLFNNSGKLGGALFYEKTLYGIILMSVYAHENCESAAVGFFYTTSLTKGRNQYFNNRGKGAIRINNASVTLGEENYFRNNSGSKGAIGVFNNSRVVIEGKAEIVNNHGFDGGGAITITMSELIFQQGEFVICENIGESGGGGINAFSSNISIEGIVSFCSNNGLNGGALSLTSEAISRLNLNGVMTFDSNRATLGGALHISGVSVTLSGIANFSSNSASTGGALYIEFNSVIYMENNFVLWTAGNTAADFGGAIFHKDSVTDLQCSNISDLYQQQNKVWALPIAFLQVMDAQTCPSITSFNDLAEKDGSFLYGGLLDRSRMKDSTTLLPFHFFTKRCSINITHSSNKNVIASDPYQLRFCDDSSIDFISSTKHVWVFRGQDFYMDMVAIGQGSSMVQATVIATTSFSAKLNLNQNTRFIGKNCSKLKFNVFSRLNDSNSLENMTLHSDGLCQTDVDSVLIVHVHLMPCPNAFIQSGDKCDCEWRLKKYVNCSIEDKVLLSQSEGPKAWINGSYNKNGSYEGLIIYSRCPIFYCVLQKSDINLDSPDEQCVSMRRGVLCGQCATNYSLLLGNSQCGLCSNYYLSLIPVFALAGIILLLLLSVTGFTVVTGALSGFILYANLIEANKRYLFFTDKPNPLTVFVAWMNLDFGFNICFYDGMDAYVHTWLQYLFPAYILGLMGILIVARQRFKLASKLAGPNPTAVFATILLMSYNKILKVIIDVLFYVNLEYPNEKYVAVWMKDGNVAYLQVKHLILSLFTIAILVFLCLPYTTLLVFGQCLFRIPNRRYLQLLNKIKPILISYQAPYKPKTRYWTGLLLLLRWFLSLVFSFNPLGGSQYSFLAMIVCISAIGALSWLNKGIYKDFRNDVIEISLYLNLIILSATATTLSKENAVIMANVLVASALVTFFGVFLHHLHICYFSNTALYKRIKAPIMKRFKSSDENKPLVDDSKEKTNVVSYSEVRITSK